MRKKQKEKPKKEKKIENEPRPVLKRPNKNDHFLRKVVSSISHPQLPNESIQPWQSDVFNLFIFIYLVIALCGQYLYMYKRFWWWPIDQRGVPAQNSSLNFSAIDIRVALMILLSLAQPLTTFFVIQGHASLSRLVKDEFKSINCVRFHLDVIKCFGSCLVLISWMTGFLHLTTYFINQECYTGMCVLTAPLFFKGLRCLWRINEFLNKVKKKYGESFKPTWFHTYITAGQMLMYEKDILQLGEMTEVKSIRHETEFMMRDFRKRLILMFCPAIEAAYYTCFVPWYFKPPTIYVEYPWCVVHAILIIVNILIYRSSHEFYPAYLHATYKIAGHVGGWKEISGPIDDDTEPWREGERYFQDRIVSFQEKRYKATGKFINAAMPGSKKDRLFVALFGEKFLVYKAMAIFQMVIVSTQLFLMHNAEWDRLVALCLEQFHGYWNLFRIVRNWFTVNRAYKESEPRAHDPLVTIPKICEVLGKEYCKIGLK